MTEKIARIIIAAVLLLCGIALRSTPVSGDDYSYTSDYTTDNITDYDYTSPDYATDDLPDPDKFKIIMFREDGCNNCDKAEMVISNMLKKNHPNWQFLVVDLKNDDEDSILALNTLCEELKMPQPDRCPFIMIETSKWLSGYDKSIDQKVDKAIRAYEKEVDRKNELANM